jgi:hypothetical protein
VGSEGWRGGGVGSGNRRLDLVEDAGRSGDRRLDLVEDAGRFGGVTGCVSSAFELGALG